MASGKRPIVLVPGACLGGWVWRQVATALRAHGHDVHPVTLTGLGERAHLASRSVDLATHVEDVVNVLDYEALEEAVLLGHSYAGAVVTGVAARRPQRLHAVAYLDAGPLPAGATVIDLASAPQREQQQREVLARGDGWLWPVPDEQTLRAGTFGSASGLEDAHFQLLAARATPQPFATFTSRLELADGGCAAVRRVAILCSAGGLSVAALRDLLAAGDGRVAAFADPDWELHELPTGHWPMLSLPGPLAELLGAIASTAA